MTIENLKIKDLDKIIKFISKQYDSCEDFITDINTFYGITNYKLIMVITSFDDNHDCVAKQYEIYYEAIKIYDLESASLEALSKLDDLAISLDSVITLICNGAMIYNNITAKEFEDNAKNRKPAIDYCNIINYRLNSIYHSNDKRTINEEMIYSSDDIRSDLFDKLLLTKVSITDKPKPKQRGVKNNESYSNDKINKQGKRERKNIFGFLRNRKPR